MWEGEGKVGQITVIPVGSFSVWIIHKCFDKNNYEIKQQCEAILCYFENIFNKAPTVSTAEGLFMLIDEAQEKKFFSKHKDF